MTLYPERVRYGYKRLETDEEFRARVLLKWDRMDSYAKDVCTATGEALDKLAWAMCLIQRKIIDVY